MLSTLPRPTGPRFLALGFIGAFTSALPAQAQTAPPAETDTPPANLGGVTVTDTAIDQGSYRTDRLSSPKATAPLLDTPRSITVISHQLIEDTASTTLTEALRTVPGITLGAGEGGNPLGDRPFIRGADNSNALYLDGVRDLAAQTRETFDVETIEITKGSDSVTNGAANAGGSINVVSKQPETHRFVQLDASGGTADYKRFTLDLNQPLGGNVGLRLNALYHDQGIAGRDDVWQKRWGIAPTLRIGMEGPTSLTLGWYHMHSNELPDSGIPYTTIATSPALHAGINDIAPLGTTPFTTASGATISRPRGAFYGLTDRDYRTTTTDDASARAQHRFANGFVLSDTARTTHTTQDYVWTQPDDSKGNVYNYGTVGRRALSRASTQSGIVDAVDLTGQFNTGPLHHSFTASAEYDWETSGYDAYYANAATGTVLPLSIACPTPASGTDYNCTSAANPTPNDPWTGTIQAGPPNSRTLANETTLSAALYDTITLGDHWVATLGGRFDHYVTHASAALAAPFTGTRVWQRKLDDLATWQAGLAYKPARNGNIYISAATAAIPPGSFLAQGSEDNSLTTTPGVTADDLKVQKTTSIEAGTKWDLFDGALALTADVFQTRTTNARVTDSAGNVTFIGLKRVRGIELSASGNVTPTLNIFGGYAHMPSRILNGGNSLVNGVYVPAASTGMPFPNTPRDSLTLFTTWQATPKFTLGGGAMYMSRVYGGYAYGTSTAVIRATYVPDYWRFDANAAYKFNRIVTLKVSALNLTDKLYYDEAYATHYAHQAAGRTVIGTLSVKY